MSTGPNRLASMRAAANAAVSAKKRAEQEAEETHLKIARNTQLLKERALNIRLEAGVTGIDPSEIRKNTIDRVFLMDPAANYGGTYSITLKASQSGGIGKSVVGTIKGGEFVIDTVRAPNLGGGARRKRKTTKRRKTRRHH